MHTEGEKGTRSQDTLSEAYMIISCNSSCAHSGVSKCPRAHRRYVNIAYIICGQRVGARGLEHPQGASGKTGPLSGISKPRFCQTYGLQFVAFHENDGNHENDENDSDSHKQGG